MKALAITSESGFPPTPKRWTLEQCDVFREQGFLQGRYELIEGIIIDKMGQSGYHAYLIGILSDALARLFLSERIRVQTPIRILGELGVWNEPEPDVTVTKEGRRAYKEENPSPEDLLLVVEIADSSLRFDLSVKAQLYAQSGISEYWVLDVIGRRVIVHREPTVEGYESVTEWSEGESLSPLALPTSSLAISDLLG